MSSIDQSIADSLEYYGKQIIAWAKVRALFEPVVLAFDELEVSATFSSDSILYVSAYGDKKRLAEVVRVLRTRGWNTETKPEEKSPEYKATFTVEATEYAPFPPKGSVYLMFTSSVCRRVKTGTKMVEQDVFEVQCGDVETAVDDMPF